MLEPVGRYVRRETDEFEALVAVRERRDRGRRARAVAVALAIVAVAAGLTSRVYWADEGSRLADTPTPDAEIAPSQQIPGSRSETQVVDLRTGEVTSLSFAVKEWRSSFDVSPDRAEVAFVAESGQRQRLWVAGADGSGERPVGTVGAWVRPGDGKPGRWEAMDPRWSPTEPTLVVYERGGYGSDGVFIVDTETDQETRIAKGYWDGAISPPMLPTFTPDGTTVVFGRRWDLWSVPATGGEPTLLRENAAAATFSPDGAQVALLSGLRPQCPYCMLYRATRITLAETESIGADRTIIQGKDISDLRWSPDGTRIAYYDRGTVWIFDVASDRSVSQLKNSNPADTWAFDWLDRERVMFRNVGPW